MEGSYWGLLDESERGQMTECWKRLHDRMEAVRALVAAREACPVKLDGAGADAEALHLVSGSELGAAVLASPADPSAFFDGRAAAHAAERGGSDHAMTAGVVGMHLTEDLEGLAVPLRDGVAETLELLGALGPVERAAREARDLIARS